VKIMLSFLLLLFISVGSPAQDTTIKKMLTESTALSVSNQNARILPGYKHRQWLVGGLSVAVYGGSLIALNKAWYQHYPRSSFHTFNDIGEWLQMDKTGHGWTAYNYSRVATALWSWAGLPNNRSALIGSLGGFVYMTVIEFLDAHSAEWGWSWGDMAANVSGSGLFAVQQMAWKEQRIQFKFSVHRTRYEGDLENRADDLFGKSLPERLLKDYNAQTYWLSFNLSSFMPESRFPGWLDIAMGYGANGMFGGYRNIAQDKNGNITFYRPDIKRYRQWYLSPDVDFSRIKTKSKVLKTVFAVVNILKIPAPSLEFSQGRLKSHWLQF
jgi:hypothetical protein